MQRRALGRDRGLTARIAAVFILLGVSLAAVVAAIVWLFFFLPTWWPLWAAAAVAVTLSILIRTGGAETSLVKVADADLVDDADEPHLIALASRTAAMLDLPAPRVAVSRADLPNGFATALTTRRAIVVVTERMRSTLEEDELEAVIAHELSHIANGDAKVMTAASIPRTIGRELFMPEEASVWIWFFLWPLGFLLYAWSSFLTLALSRYREYSADRVAALATGRPESLMSALEKLTNEIGGIPADDLRSVESLNQLFIVPVTHQHRLPTLLRDHPPLERRLAQLASIARRLGKPRD